MKKIICVKEIPEHKILGYFNRVTIGDICTLISRSRMGAEERNEIDGEYEYYIDNEGDAIFIPENHFCEHFQLLGEYRQNKINEILNGE